MEYASGNDTSWLKGSYGNYAINPNYSMGSSSSTTTTNGVVAPRPTPAPPPVAPDLSGLQSLQNVVNRRKMIKDALGQYDKLSASTLAAGNQAASIAGTTYANRLLQTGQNPLASGVVAAQAKLPVYQSLEEINTDRAKTQLDATSKADSLAAQIASNIANLQLSYSKTLADFNQQQTAYDLDLNKFNATQLSTQTKNSQDNAYRYAALAAAGGGSVAGGHTGTVQSATGLTTNPLDRSGYVTNSGLLQPAVVNGVVQPNKVIGGGGANYGGIFSINTPGYNFTRS